MGTGEQRRALLRVALAAVLANCGLPTGAASRKRNRRGQILDEASANPVRSRDEAIAGANAVAYGLTSGILSGHAGRGGHGPGVQAFCELDGQGVSGKGGRGPHYIQQFVHEQTHTVMT